MRKLIVISVLLGLCLCWLLVDVSAQTKAAFAHFGACVQVLDGNPAPFLRACEAAYDQKAIDALEALILGTMTPQQKVLQLEAIRKQVDLLALPKEDALNTALTAKEAEAKSEADTAKGGEEVGGEIAP